MTKEMFKVALMRSGIQKGQATKLAKKMEEEVMDYFYASEMEIWSPGCRYRLQAARGDKDWAVCYADDPLHPIKEYVSLGKALAYMEDNDQ